MRNVTLALPAFAFVIATRAALAAGVALLVAGKLPASRRRALGRALLAIGVVTTIPAARLASRGISGRSSTVDTDPRLVGTTRLARKGDDIV
jgi:ribose 1,5-bisphosphokinase PhnN